MGGFSSMKAKESQLVWTLTGQLQNLHLFVCLVFVEFFIRYNRTQISHKVQLLYRQSAVFYSDCMWATCLCLLFLLDLPACVLLQLTCKCCCCEHLRSSRSCCSFSSLLSNFWQCVSHSNAAARMTTNTLLLRLKAWRATESLHTCRQTSRKHERVAALIQCRNSLRQIYVTDI